MGGVTRVWALNLLAVASDQEESAKDGQRRELAAQAENGLAGHP